MSLTAVSKHISDQLDAILDFDARVTKAYDKIEELYHDETLTERQRDLALDALNELELV